MGDSFRAGGRAFRANFSSEGEQLLKKEVKAKLEDLMGYEDDVLADYIIVLVKNGKREEVAEQDLHVFLGDDSSSFVSWLWDHLSSNLDIYVKTQGSSQGQADPNKLLIVDHTNGDGSQSAYKNESMPMESDHLQEVAVKEASGRRKRRWEGPTRDESEPPPLRTSELDDYFLKDHNAHHARSNDEKGHNHHKERMMVETNRETDQRTRKRSFNSKPVVDSPHQRLQSARTEKSEAKVNPPHRLLQFAMREALGPLRSTGSARSEPAVKRLRSVVLPTIRETSVAGFSQRDAYRPVSKVSMITAMRAAAEAAYDTSTIRPARNVMDRLNFNSGKEISGYVEEFCSPHSVEPGSGDDRNLEQEFDFPDHRRSQPENLKLNVYNRETEASLTNLDRNTEAYSSIASDNDVYDDEREGVEINQPCYAGNNDNMSQMMRYRLTPQPEEVLRTEQLKEHSSVVIEKPTHKIVNISVNVNAWKPSHFRSTINLPKVEEQTASQDKGSFACKTSARLVQDKEGTVATDRRKESPSEDPHKKEVMVSSLSGSHSSLRSSADVESRIIYVSNVHFGATKDSLSTHFNKCGEVQKVVIVPDAATGQPTGSAYVEFVRKESAELALSLNGKSFMSRILKVVPRNSVSQEATQMAPWSGFQRHKPYSFRPTPAISFPRGVSGIYTRPPPLKVGPRSLQWKRDSPSSGNTASNPQLPSPAGTPFAGTSLSATPRRALTYVRDMSKPAN